ncbi:ArsR/SmtB family transcription factor [Microbacterium memoriense]|uniref:Helix-turn-helix domain-containing protein n=1 Tax=Microbacterium memoriense TaxID=2978350 RepID=A0ABT2PB35_9MICO|nr:helix-turn-helix domain-containing protein [Microbacterium memoriense]MCT9001629.1 helix-turn-helix domain-containing protein [Microbacterium memoriense]
MASQDDPDQARQTPDTGERMLDAGALRALAHPIRVRIFDILSQYGPQTASSLAERLHESSGSTSYHLRALAKQDLIREVPDRGTARERWWERPHGAVSFGNPEALRTPSGRAATQVVVTETLNRRHQQLMEFIDRGLTPDMDGEWRDSTIITTATARLNPTQLRELSEKVQALIDEYVTTYRDQTGDGVRPVTIRADLFPLPE